MRKSTIVTIEAQDGRENRDAGKRFKLTEMDAEAAEWWAVRALGAIQRAGFDMPQDVVESGMIGMAAVGLRSFMGAPIGEIKPLLDEMMGCVQIIMPAAPDGRALLPNDIEEVSTRVRLRDEVFKLHTGFSIATALLTAVAAYLQSPEEVDGALNSSSTPMSPGPSAP
ncbi:MAG TPA: hypothetical protein VJP88_07490 [Caulobacteraceae bacterium]|nr:hypothetical protein [Caulobacteraceae bacterium]